MVIGTVGPVMVALVFVMLLLAAVVVRLVRRCKGGDHPAATHADRGGAGRPDDQRRAS